MLRSALVLALALAGPAMAAEPEARPPRPPPPPAAAPTGDHISAAIIVRELKGLGIAATVDTDDSGDPRVTMTVDGYEWSIYFYGCAPGARDERACTSYQFYSGYTLAQPLAADIINRWNTQQRYARAYTYVQRNGRHSARIEIDVRSAGTGADPGRTFRQHFEIMRDKSVQFRKTIGFQ